MYSSLLLIVTCRGKINIWYTKIQFTLNQQLPKSTTGILFGDSLVSDKKGTVVWNFGDSKSPHLYYIWGIFAKSFFLHDPPRMPYTLNIIYLSGRRWINYGQTLTEIALHSPGDQGTPELEYLTYITVGGNLHDMHILSGSKYLKPGQHASWQEIPFPDCLQLSFVLDSLSKQQSFHEYQSKHLF